MTKRPPIIVSLSVSAQLAFTGEEIELTWQARGHEQLVLETPWGEILSIDTQSVRLVPARSGSYVLRATNRFGEVEVTTDPVHVYTPPQVGFIDVPVLSGVSDILERMDPDTERDILSIPQGSAELWRGLAAALPTATIPVESMVVPIAPALSPPTVNWSELTNVIEKSFRSGTRAAETEVSRQGRGGFFSKLRRPAKT